jgi:hypothetical protein
MAAQHSNHPQANEMARHVRGQAEPVGKLERIRIEKLERIRIDELERTRWSDPSRRR